MVIRLKKWVLFSLEHRKTGYHLPNVLGKTEYRLHKRMEKLGTIHRTNKKISFCSIFHILNTRGLSYLQYEE